jgi:hypothetical protein
MTKFSKIMAVFVTFASIAFMGFAVASFQGGPNWAAERDKLTDFSFERPSKDSPWSVKSRVNDEQAGSGKTLPEAIVAAQKKKIADQQAALQKLDQDKARAAERLKQTKDLIELDKVALQKRADVLEKERRDLTDKIVAAQAKAVAITKDAQAKYETGKLRRGEYLLMKNQFEELKAQRAAAEREVASLTDQLIQAQGVLERAKLRNELLRSDGAHPYEDEPQANEKAGAAPAAPEMP